MSEHTLPKLEHPEQGGVIGAAWMSPKRRALLLSRLQPADFVGPDRVLAEALAGQGDEERFDYLVAESRLDDGARARLLAIQAALADEPDLRDFDRWLAVVEDRAVLRQMHSSLGALREQITPTANPRQVMSQVVMSMVNINSRAAGEVKPIDEAVDSALEIVEAWRRGETYMNAVPTGFARLDRSLGGLARRHICTLAARPGRGKTQLSLQILRNVAHRIKVEHRDAVVLMFSAEMTEEELVLRLAQTTSGVSTEWVREGSRPDGTPLTDAERERYTAALNNLRGLPFVIDPTSAPTTMHMYRQVAAQRALHKDGVDLVVFDYLELAGDTGGRGANETNRVGIIMRGLKKIAKDHDCTVLVVAQLNRNVDKKDNRLPELDDLRQSGDIEALSQQVVFIDWPDSYKTADGKLPRTVQERSEFYSKYGGNAGLIIAKNRNGRSRTTIAMQFRPAITRLEEVTLP